MINLLNSDARRIPLADRKAQCIITSPPYWGLRDYGTATWQGGDPGCNHSPADTPSRRGLASSTLGGGKETTGHQREGYGTICRRCGAIRIDAQIGLERVPDCLGWATGRPCGECYVCHIVAVMRECWRVLRDDGVCWLNLGDSYAGSGKGQNGNGEHAAKHGEKQHTNRGTITGGLPSNYIGNGLKPKDLCMIPARVALALQADGWYLRSMIPWLKRNSMPESVTDRPSNAVEYVYLLSKSEKYYFDNEAIKKESNGWNGSKFTDERDILTKPNLGMAKRNETSSRNRRNSDWLFESWQGLYMVDNEPAALIVNPQPYSGAHFATFPSALVEPMILAGTSARGACPTCGKAWVRVVDKGLTAHDGNTDSAYQSGTTANRLALLRQASRERGEEYTNQTTTLGWRPACSCYDVPPLPDEPDDTSNGDMAAYRAERARLLDLYATLPVVPCIVLDPLAGSGTVGKVAVKHGRRFVGCELNREYIDLAFERTSKVQTVMQL